LHQQGPHEASKKFLKLYATPCGAPVTLQKGLSWEEGSSQPAKQKLRLQLFSRKE
jgi:hypothetical protein